MKAVSLLVFGGVLLLVAAVMLLPLLIVFGALLLPLLLAALGVASMIFWIWMLIDCIKNPRLSETEKIVWVLVIVFTHFVGGLIYFFAGRTSSKTAGYA